MKGNIAFVSVRNSLKGVYSNKSFYYCYIVGLIAVVVYACSLSIDLGKWLSISYDNTVNASYDRTLIEVEYINEEGTVFLGDGSSIEGGTYSYIQTIVGSGIWYSTEQGAVCIPVSVGEIFEWVMKFLLLIPIIMVLVFIASKFDRDIWGDTVFTVLLIRFLDLAFIVMCLAYPRGIMKALSGEKWVWVVGVVGFILGIMLIMLTEKLLRNYSKYDD